MIFEARTTIEFECGVIPFVHFQMKSIYPKSFRFCFEKFHCAFGKSTAAKFRHDVELVDERIGAEKLKAKAERKHDVADRLFVHYQKPNAAAPGMIEQGAKRFADQRLPKGAGIRVRLLFSQSPHHREQIQFVGRSCRPNYEI